jgi:eukaryotic-like serine/threonine-protein kinase
MSPAGRTLGRYRIAHEIARGGMGVVCHATDTTLGRDVALKLLPADLAEDAARRRRFVQEARAAAALEHPHIAVIHDAGEIDGQAYIAMELIRGTSLAVEIGQRPLPMARAIQLALQMASGLARAHEGHVVHRDLKPSNVMVTADGHAKIIDFGIAKVLDGVDAPEDSTRTRLTTSPGAVVGTTAYMSPEQVRGGTVDHRSDVFAFGVVLHEMVTGRIPFAGSTSLETATAILRDAAPRLDLAGTVPLGVTADLQRVIDKCLAKDADDRYQGMRDVAVDLRAISRQLDATPATAAPLAGVAGADAGGRASQPRRSWRHIWAAVGLGVAGAGIWLATALWTDPRSSSGASAALPATPEKPRVAVLYFDNTSADRELDWLRAGITEMVVTICRSRRRSKSSARTGCTRSPRVSRRPTRRRGLRTSSGPWRRKQAPTPSSSAASSGPAARCASPPVSRRPPRAV